MDTGSACGWRRSRSAIQSPSRQEWALRNTSEAVSGGRSAACAMGSAFRRSDPSAPRISYL